VKNLHNDCRQQRAQNGVFNDGILEWWPRGILVMLLARRHKVRVQPRRPLSASQARQRSTGGDPHLRFVFSAFARIDPHNAAVSAELSPYVRRDDNIYAGLVSAEKELSGTYRGSSPDRTGDDKPRVVGLVASAR
jgi:hypothetical protein